MAKEIVIEQNWTDDFTLEMDDRGRLVYINQYPKDCVSVETVNIPRLISALCELSGVSGDATIILDRCYFDADGCKYYSEKAPYVEYDQVAPLVARLQAENEALKKHNDSANESVKFWKDSCSQAIERGNEWKRLYDTLLADFRKESNTSPNESTERP